jgi:hypothetical protein
MEPAKRHRPSCPPIDSVPKDVMILLLTYLDFSSFFSCRGVCRKWCRLVKELLQVPTAAMELCMEGFMKELAAVQTKRGHGSANFENFWKSFVNRTNVPYATVIASCRCGGPLFYTRCERCCQAPCVCSTARNSSLCCKKIHCCFMRQFALAFGVCMCKLSRGYCRKRAHVDEFTIFQLEDPLCEHAQVLNLKGPQAHLGVFLE